MAVVAGDSQSLDRMAALDFSREIARLTQDFTGREWLFGEVDSWLTRAAEPFFLLTGEPGAGKSAFAARLTQIRSDIGAFHFCIAGQSATVTPGTALGSLAVQLAQHVPGYGLALLNTIKPVQLSIQLTIRVKTMTGGQITGVVIKHLSPSDPVQEFEILLRAPLAALPVPTTPLVVLVDSLDEAVTYAGEPNLVALLVKDLPSWVRIVCTTRPDSRVLRYFPGVTPFVLAAESQMNLKDNHRYVEFRVARAPLLDRLQTAGTKPDALVENLTKNLSAGNFLYTKVLLDDIEAGRQLVADLDQLPRSLDEIYHGFLNRFSVREWQEQYQPILSVLTAALEPVSENQLAKFPGTVRTNLRQNLGVVRQFLDVVEMEPEQKMYRLYHQSLRDYLLSEERNQDFWCAPEDGHRLIARAYGATEKACDAGSLEKVDKYGLTHLAAHILRAGWDEALHQLLGGAWARIKERQEGSLAGFLADLDLAWRKAEAENELGRQIRCGLFHSSVRALAGQLPPTLLAAAVQGKFWQPVQALRYAGEITDERRRADALVALASVLSPDLWEDAAQLAHSLQYAPYRLNALAALCARVPEEKRVEAGREALEIIRNLEYDSSKPRALAAIATALPAEQMAAALEIALSIKPSDDRAAALAAALPRLPETVFAAARNAVESLDGQNLQVAEAFMALAKLVPVSEQIEVWRKALTVAGHPKNEQAGESLAEVLPELPLELLPPAIEIVRELNRPIDRVRAAAALLPRLSLPARKAILSDVLKAISQMPGGTDPLAVRWYAAVLPYFPADAVEGVIATALAEARNNDYAAARVEGLACLIPQVPERLRDPLRAEALLGAGQPDNSFRRSEAMVALAPQLLPADRSNLLNLVSSLQDESDESRALAGMAPNLSPDDLGRALEIANDMSQDEFRLRVVEGIAPYLPPSDLPRALDIARSIRDRGARGELLVNLALALTPAQCPVLPDRIIEEANFINSASQRTQVLSSLVSWLPEALHSKVWTYVLTSLAACSSIELEQALRPLPDFPESVLDEVLKLIDKRFISEQTSALLCLAPRLSQPRFEGLIKRVFEMPLASVRAQALVAILPKIKVGDRQGYLTSFLDGVAGEQESERADAIATLAPLIQGKLMDDALSMARNLKGDSYRAQALCALLPQLQGPRRESALQAATEAMAACEYWLASEEVLEKLAPYLDTHAQVIGLNAIRMIPDATYRARALASLLPYLAQSGRPKVAGEILAACEEMYFAVDRLQVLIQIAPHLSPEVGRQEILKTVRQTQYAHQRARALLDALPFVPRPEWPQHLIAALETGSQWPTARDRAEAWRGLIEAWQSLAEPDAHSVWQHALRALAARPRPDLLVDFVLMVPMLRSLGGQQAVIDSIRALEEAATIWA